MSNFGHVKRVTREVGGKTYTFRSKLEYRWAVWCQLRKEQGIIVDWWFEDEKLELITKLGDRKYYIPDFTIQAVDGYEFEETKGWFTSKDATKIKLASQQYENPITLIFASRPSKKQLWRAQHLEPHIKRIIYTAGRDIFKPIKHLFDI